MGGCLTLQRNDICGFNQSRKRQRPVLLAFADASDSDRKGSVRRLVALKQQPGTQRQRSDRGEESQNQERLRLRLYLNRRQS